MSEFAADDECHPCLSSLNDSSNSSAILTPYDVHQRKKNVVKILAHDKSRKERQRDLAIVGEIFLMYPDLMEKYVYPMIDNEILAGRIKKYTMKPPVVRKQKMKTFVESLDMAKVLLTLK